LLLGKGCVGAKTKVLSKKKGDLDASHHSGISRERSGGVFFLDILAHRLNSLHQMDGWNRDRP
jgi:hypothetical protein